MEYINYHPTSNLKSKNLCGQFSVKAFLSKGLPGKKSRLNRNAYVKNKLS